MHDSSMGQETWLPELGALIGEHAHMGALRGALRGALIWAHSWAHSYRSTQRRTHREADVRRTAGGDSADLQRRLAGARQGIVLTRPEQNADTGRKIRKSSEQPGKPGCRNAGSPKSPRAGNREKGDPPRLAGRLLFSLRAFLAPPRAFSPCPFSALPLLAPPLPRPAPGPLVLQASLVRSGLR